nr:MAG TPA: hypothetical protein [Caudoviricetes sp.]
MRYPNLLLYKVTIFSANYQINSKLYEQKKQQNNDLHQSG